MKTAAAHDPCTSTQNFLTNPRTTKAPRRGAPTGPFEVERSNSGRRTELLRKARPAPTVETTAIRPKPAPASKPPMPGPRPPSPPSSGRTGRGSVLRFVAAVDIDQFHAV